MCKHCESKDPRYRYNILNHYAICAQLRNRQLDNNEIEVNEEQYCWCEEIKSRNEENRNKREK